jgi:hypothetical protein
VNQSLFISIHRSVIHIFPDSLVEVFVMDRQKTSHEEVTDIHKHMQLNYGQGGPCITRTEGNDQTEYPSLSQIMSELTSKPPAIAPGASKPLSLEEQRTLFDSLQNALRIAEIRYQVKQTTDAKEAKSSFEQVDAVFEGVQSILYQLWGSRSHYMVQAAEALANGSRNRK